MDPKKKSNRDQVPIPRAYAQWAAVNDLGFCLRRFLDPTCEYASMIIAGQYMHRGSGPAPYWAGVCARYDYDYDIADCRSVLAECYEWCVAGYPDGFKCENVVEYWSQLDPHVRAKDTYWEKLVAETAPLRAKGVDLHGAGYREMLEAFVAKHLSPLA